MKSISKDPSKSHLSMNWATSIILVLWLLYTLVEGLFQSGRLNEITALLIQVVPGLLGIAVLHLAGFTLEDCCLRLKKASRVGLTVLALWFILLLPILLPGKWTGWNPLGALVYAPLSAITQELFFRSSLLPALFGIFKNRLWLALLLHTTLFGLWHVGPIVQGAPVGGIFIVMFVPFLSGLVWGWVAQRDRTVVWVILFHSLTLVLNTFFTWS